MGTDTIQPWEKVRGPVVCGAQWSIVVHHSGILATQESDPPTVGSFIGSHSIRKTFNLSNLIYLTVGQSVQQVLQNTRCLEGHLGTPNMTEFWVNDDKTSRLFIIPLSATLLTASKTKFLAS